MSKKGLKQLGLFILICVVVVSFNNANAATLLFDDFNDGDDDGWTQQLGSWSVVSGHYDTNMPNDDFYTVRGDFGWSNYIVEADIKMNGWENDVGLVFYNQANKNHIRFTVVLDDDSDLVRLEHGVWTGAVEFEHTSIATYINNDISLERDTWYHFKVVIAGDSVSAYIDDVLYAYSDSLPYSSGNIGLTWDDDNPSLTASFDNVRVSTVPVPAAFWLFGSAFAGLIRLRSPRKKFMGQKFMGHNT